MIRSIFSALVCIWLFGSFQLSAQQGPSDRKLVEGISTTQFTEFAPTISADGNTMIIESNKNETREAVRWELFESSKNADGTWAAPTPLTAINQKCNFVAGPSLSYDGNRIYFTAVIEGVNESEDIFYSDRLAGAQWSEPISVGAPINTDDYEGFSSISADGNSLYFIRINYDNPRDKKSKENCFEIFVSRKQADGKWGEPEKLPEQINMGCVRDPRIMADNHTLIFSAITPQGKGKYDLFQSRKDVDGNWVEARSLDFINSIENDQSPSISAAGDIIYFMSNKDIYAMPVPLEYRQLINVTVQGFVSDGKNGRPISASVSVLNLETNERMVLANNSNDGRYSLVLSAGSHFRVEFVNPGYLKKVEDFDLRKQETYKEIDVDVGLMSEYSAKVVPTDSQLKIPVTAFVKVSDQKGNLIWNDSIRADQLTPSLKFESANQYTISAFAENFTETEQPIVFNTETFRADTIFSLIMTHEKIKFSADVMDITSNKRVKTRVTFNNLSQDEVIIAESGESVYLRKGDRYEVIASSDKGYFFSTTHIIAGEGEPGPDGNHGVSVLMTPIKEGAQLTLNNITFETNLAELNSSSFAELDRVIELMHQNPTVKIEIAAHTDDVGNAGYNLKLSARRAESAISYFNKKGIVNERLEAKGYGKDKPVVPNDSEANRAINRRIELIILKVE
ncbi:MAG: OmpA family protein [Bacteroidia bacterium]|nr:OmpA family protein [Bacteroidia bacterium]